jgi:hypothetical protein
MPIRTITKKRKFKSKLVKKTRQKYKSRRFKSRCNKNKISKKRGGGLESNYLLKGFKKSDNKGFLSSFSSPLNTNATALKYAVGSNSTVNPIHKKSMSEKIDAQNFSFPKSETSQSPVQNMFTTGLNSVWDKTKQIKETVTNSDLAKKASVVQRNALDYSSDVYKKTKDKLLTKPDDSEREIKSFQKNPLLNGESSSSSPKNTGTKISEQFRNITGSISDAAKQTLQNNFSSPKDLSDRESLLPGNETSSGPKPSSTDRLFSAASNTVNFINDKSRKVYNDAKNSEIGKKVSSTATIVNNKTKKAYNDVKNSERGKQATQFINDKKNKLSTATSNITSNARNYYNKMNTRENISQDPKKVYDTGYQNSKTVYQDVVESDTAKKTVKILNDGKNIVVKHVKETASCIF